MGHRSRQNGEMVEGLHDQQQDAKHSEAVEKQHGERGAQTARAETATTTGQFSRSPLR